MTELCGVAEPEPLLLLTFIRGIVRFKFTRLSVHRRAISDESSGYRAGGEEAKRLITALGFEFTFG